MVSMDALSGYRSWKSIHRSSKFIRPIPEQPIRCSSRYNTTSGTPGLTFYSDNARDIIKAVQYLGFGGHHEFSQPGMPQTNGIAERAVQEVVSGTRTLLVQAGLLGYVWSKAATCYCLLHNTRVFPHVHCVQACDAAVGTDAASVEHLAHPVVAEEIPQNAWAKRHGTDFT